MFQNSSESEFLSFSDFISKKGESSQKDVLNDEWIFQSFFGCFLFSVWLNKGFEAKGISSIDFLLKKSGKLRNTFKFSNLIFKDLISHELKEILLFSLFIFNFLFNNFSQLAGKLFLVRN